MIIPDVHSKIGHFPFGDTAHVVRVIYKERDNLIQIITFYPGRKERYESKL